jgi:hypothetical protein
VLPPAATFADVCAQLPLSSRFVSFRFVWAVRCVGSAALRVPIKWEVFERVGDITQNFDLLASLARNQLCLKGA